MGFYNFMYLVSGFALGLCFTEMWDEKRFEKRFEELRRNKNKKIMELKIKNDILQQANKKKGD